MANKGTDFGVRYLSGSNIAALYGDLIKLSTINKWVEKGLVDTDYEGRRNEQQILTILIKNKDAEIERLKAERLPSEDLKEQIERARLRKLLLEGDLIEIEKDSKLEELIRRDEAIAEIDDAFAKVRSKLMTLPNRLALEISGMTEPTDIKSRLDEVVREALEELNHTLMSADESDSEE